MPKYPVLDVAVREWTVRMHVNVLCWQFTETTGARLVARMRRVLRTRRAPDEDPQQSCCGSETFPQIAEAQSDASKEGMGRAGLKIGFSHVPAARRSWHQSSLGRRHEPLGADADVHDTLQGSRKCLISSLRQRGDACTSLEIVRVELRACDAAEMPPCCG